MNGFGGSSAALRSQQKSGSQKQCSPARLQAGLFFIRLLKNYCGVDLRCCCSLTSSTYMRVRLASPLAYAVHPGLVMAFFNKLSGTVMDHLPMDSKCSGANAGAEGFPAQRHLTSTEICFGFISSLLGRVMVRIPLSQLALIRSWAMERGREKLRWNAP